MEERPLKQVRSFIRRERKVKQPELFEALWKKYGLSAHYINNLDALFQSNIQNPLTLEIGFGTGDSLFEQAKAYPHQQYIGIEVYRTGILGLLLKLENSPLDNLRLFEGDAVEIVNVCFPDESLDRIQILFPDPWPKARHHKRRLIQPEFVALLTKKLKKDGLLYLATDWYHYAKQMQHILENEPGLTNEAGKYQFCIRDAALPLTKFEQRGLKEGRGTWQLCFSKCH